MDILTSSHPQVDHYLISFNQVICCSLGDSWVIPKVARTSYLSSTLQFLSGYGPPATIFSASYYNTLVTFQSSSLVQSCSIFAQCLITSQSVNYLISRLIAWLFTTLYYQTSRKWTCFLFVLLFYIFLLFLFFFIQT